MSASISNQKSVHTAAGRFASTQWSLASAARRYNDRRAASSGRSTNQGENWTTVNMGMIGRAVQALAAVGPNIFAGAPGISNGGAFRSDNGGDSWTAINTGLPPGQPFTSFAVVGTNIFAATGENVVGSGVYRSTNQGESWTATNAGL